MHMLVGTPFVKVGFAQLHEVLPVTSPGQQGPR